ncbi:MAG: glycosyl hydrolase, partial [Planctomycetaceae bacterium]
STQGMFINRKAPYEKIVFPDWAPKEVHGVPFVLIDPQGERIPNAVLLYASWGEYTPRMPKSVMIPCNSPAAAIHVLGGVSGFGYPRSEEGTVSLIVRLHYADGGVENHELKNGVHLADFMQRVDVPGSEFAYQLGGSQVRFLTVTPGRRDPIDQIELLKGPDDTAPIFFAVTAETR